MIWQLFLFFYMIYYFFSILSLFPKIELRPKYKPTGAVLFEPNFKREKKIGVRIILDTKDYIELIKFLESIEYKYILVQLEPFPIIFCSLYPSEIANLKVNYILEE